MLAMNIVINSDMLPPRSLTSILDKLIPPKDKSPPTYHPLPAKLPFCCPFKWHRHPCVLGHLPSGMPVFPIFLNFLHPSWTSWTLTLSSPRFRTQSIFYSWHSDEKVGSTYPFISPQFAQRINYASHFFIYILCAVAKNAVNASNSLGAGQTS